MNAAALERGAADPCRKLGVIVRPTPTPTHNRAGAMLLGVMIGPDPKDSMGELIDVDQPWTRDDVLDADAAENPCQLADHFKLPRRARREIGMATLGRGGHETSVDVVQDGFAESGPRRDDRGVARSELATPCCSTASSSGSSTGTA